MADHSIETLSMPKGVLIAIRNTFDSNCGIETVNGRNNQQEWILNDVRRQNLIWNSIEWNECGTMAITIRPDTIMKWHVIKYQGVVYVAMIDCLAVCRLCYGGSVAHQQISNKIYPCVLELNRLEFVSPSSAVIVSIHQCLIRSVHRMELWSVCAGRRMMIVLFSKKQKN